MNDGTAEERDPSAQMARRTQDADTQQLVEKTILISGMPAGNDRNAGRMVFGPDAKLHYSIGEQRRNFGRNLRKPNLALVLPTAAEVDVEDWHTFSDKILRPNLDGSVPDANPEIF